MSSFNIMFVTSEAAPFSKTGGLADVCGSLPAALSATNRVIVVSPLYSSVNREKYGIKFHSGGCCVHMGNCEEFFALYHTEHDGVDFYFIEYDKYFNREGIYHTKAGEYGDNPFRFSFLSRAALQVAKDLNFRPDVVHANDWQTGLVPYYVKRLGDAFFEKTKSVITIHNIGYQGLFGAEFVEYAGIKPEDFNAGAFENFGGVNLLKGGLAFADKITTVSPTYAKEIRGPIGSSGLHELLNARGGDVLGILNGIDTNIWNPKKDTYIPYPYDAKSLKTKLKNKLELQKRFGLKQDENIALFGFVGRFVDQKGLHLLRDACVRAMKDMVCQFVIVGSGEQEYEEFYGSLPDRFPGEAGSFIGYSEELAHLVEAGSDFFVMPSLYEPCGLNQMYSLAYGTLPVVRATGGLEDTVENYDETTGEGTGFKFKDISSDALYNTLGWAVSTYYDRPKHMDIMRRKAMKQDFSWKKSAALYQSLYEWIVNPHLYT